MLETFEGYCSKFTDAFHLQVHVAWNSLVLFPEGFQSERLALLSFAEPSHQERKCRHRQVVLQEGLAEGLTNICHDFELIHTEPL